MAVAGTTTEVVESGNGSKVDFDFSGMKIFAASELVVYKRSAAGVYSGPLTLDVDYTVAFDSDAETGTVTYTVAPVSGGASIIRRSVALTQATEYPRDGVVAARTQENIADKLTLLLQQMQEQLNRSLIQPVTPVAPDPIDVEAPVDTKALKYQDNGDDTWTIVPSTYDPDTQVAAAAAQAAIATAQAAIATAQAVAAAASAVAAAVSAASVADAISSGLWSARPVSPSSPVAYYYATDRDSLEIWIQAAGRWFLIG